MVTHEDVRAGRTLARLTVTPTLLLVAWLVVSLPLLMAGRFTLGPAFVLFVPVAAVVLTVGLRAPVLRGFPATSWWAVAGVLAVTVAFLALQLAMNSEQIIVRRDPASYVQFATWLADHGHLPIPQLRDAFGGGDPALTYGSPAFYERHGVIIPQFMAGLPMILSLGSWIGGTYAMLAMAPILGACAVLCFSGLVARLVSPAWAPVGALALALTLPMEWVSRATYSEPAAMVLLLGGLALLVDAREPEPGGRAGAAGPGRRTVPDRIRSQALFGGLALGLTVLIRIDGLRDVLPVVVFAGLLIARRRPTGPWLLAGLAAGVGAGLLEGFVLSGPYLNYLHASLVPLLLMSAAVVAGTAVMVVVLRWRPTRVRLRRVGVRLRAGRLPDVAAVCTVLVMIGFAVRPYVQTVIRIPDNPDDKVNAAFITIAQQLNGLPVEFGRQYSELSLYWVVWYIGVPALLLATLAAALLARRLARRTMTAWLLPYAVIAWTTLTTLWRPGITPDHPWASRRLISIVIPGLLLLAVWGLAWGVRRFRWAGYGPRSTAVAGAAGVMALFVPITMTSGGLMFVKTEQDEVAGVRSVCTRLGQGSAVIIVERATADRLTEVIRGMCQVPTARLRPGATQADVRRVIGKVYAAGWKPVTLGGNAASVAPYGAAQRVVHISTRQDEHTLVTAPGGTWSLTIDVWVSEPSKP
jgi:hypothetical protein